MLPVRSARAKQGRAVKIHTNGDGWDLRTSTRATERSSWRLRTGLGSFHSRRPGASTHIGRNWGENRAAESDTSAELRSQGCVMISKLRPQK